VSLHLDPDCPHAPIFLNPKDENQAGNQDGYDKQADHVGVNPEVRDAIRWQFKDIR
jgi:hypothetical protein